MFLKEEELNQKGFKSLGKNVLISDKASIYGANNISIGNDVRIDDFCILSGNITLKNNIHIAAGSMIFGGQAGVILEDYSGTSSRCAIYALTDDFIGKGMTNPTIPEKFRNVKEAQVILGKHCVVGTGSTVLPGVHIAEGTSIGSMSFVNKNTLPWKVYYGIPAKPKRDRDKKILECEQEFIASK